ncbi:hypothetical protein [Tenacibaculum insulae]|uniref:hypothetical protein n=1 Tax=Tenacibaculum insulae TaxID=2029677 RepID=UPI003AB55A84
MELTKKQIQEIDRYLNLKGVKFVDFRSEIIDHIVSQIEEEISKGKSFNSAFTYTKLKWDSQLRSSHSWIFGTGFIAPKIVITKAKKVFTTTFFISLVPLLIAFIVVFNSKIALSKVTGHITIAAIVLLFTITLFYSLKISNSKKKTVYNFIVKTQFLNFIFLPIFLLTNPVTDFLNIGFLGYMIITTYAVRLFYIKHQEEKAKYKVSVK